MHRHIALNDKRFAGEKLSQHRLCTAKSACEFAENRKMHGDP
jgi:hypothetical protein